MYTLSVTGPQNKEKMVTKTVLIRLFGNNITTDNDDDDDDDEDDDDDGNHWRPLRTLLSEGTTTSSRVASKIESTIFALNHIKLIVY